MNKCPTISATKLELKTIKEGNDGNLWIVSNTLNGRKLWKKINLEGGTFKNNYTNQLLSIYPIKSNNIISIFIDNINKSKIINFSKKLSMHKKDEYANRILKSKSLVLGASYNENEYNRLRQIDENYIGIDFTPKSNPIPINLKKRNELNEFLKYILILRQGRLFDNIIVDLSVDAFLFLKNEYNFIKLNEPMNNSKLKSSDEFGRKIRIYGKAINGKYLYGIPLTAEYIYKNSNIDLIFEYLKEGGNFYFYENIGPNNSNSNSIPKILKKFRPDIIFKTINIKF